MLQTQEDILSVFMPSVCDIKECATFIIDKEYEITELNLSLISKQLNRVEMLLDC